MLEVVATMLLYRLSDENLALLLEMERAADISLVSAIMMDKHVIDVAWNEELKGVRVTIDGPFDHPIRRHWIEDVIEGHFIDLRRLKVVEEC